MWLSASSLTTIQKDAVYAVHNLSGQYARRIVKKPTGATKLFVQGWKQDGLEFNNWYDWNAVVFMKKDEMFVTNATQTAKIDGVYLYPAYPTQQADGKN